MSDLTQLFAVIAKEIGKEPKILDPFLNILNENFYDTVASIKDLKKEDYEQWKFPKRLADLLLQKSSETPIAKSSPQDNQIISKNPPTGQTNPSSMEVEKEKTKEQLQEESLREKLKEAKDSITSAEKQSEVLNFLRKILSNISENPSEQKFRRIKRSNKFFQMYLFPNRHAYEFLTGVGFIEEEEAIFLDDISAVKTSIAVIDDILATVNLSQFNPYATYTSGNEVMCSRNLAIKEGFINYYDELNKLKVKREVKNNSSKRRRQQEHK